MSRVLCFIARGVFAVRELLISVRKIFCQRQKSYPISSDNYNTPQMQEGLICLFILLRIWQFLQFLAHLNYI